MRAVQLLTAIRLHQPELWERICEFSATSFQNEAVVSREDTTVFQELPCRVEECIRRQDQEASQQSASSGILQERSEP